jgi:hypothetical protein
MKFNILVVFILLLLSSCLNLDYRLPIDPEKQSSYRLKPDSGFLVGSFSYYGFKPSSLDDGAPSKHPDRFSSYQFFFRGTDEANLNILGNIGFHSDFWTNKVKHDFVLDEGEGHVFAIELPAGNYEFFEYKYSISTAVGSREWSGKYENPIPFVINSEMIHYCGEVRTIHGYGKNKLGMIMLFQGFPIFLDMHERDYDLLSRKYPFLDMNGEIVRLFIKPKDQTDSVETKLTEDSIL